MILMLLNYYLTFEVIHRTTLSQKFRRLYFMKDEIRNMSVECIHFHTPRLVKLDYTGVYLFFEFLFKTLIVGTR